jgi:large subunit ribosomal protein L5
MKKENSMKHLKLGKITLNVGAGNDPNNLKKGTILLKHITGLEPIKTVTQKRLQTWGLRPGLPIGCKLTLRGKKAEDLLKRLLSARENTLKEAQFDELGNVSFGIKEYIDIPDITYNPDVGIVGFEVAITLERPGFRIKRRRIKQAKVGKNQIVRKQDSVEFMKSKFNVKVEQ